MLAAWLELSYFHKTVTKGHLKLLGPKRIVYFDIQIFFNFQTNSPNIFLHIKVVNDTIFSQFMTPISPIIKANYSEILMLNIDYYVQCAIRLNQSTQKFSL